MLMLDGRAQRSLKTCKDTLADILLKFADVKLDCQPPGPDKESRLLFKNECLAKSKILQGFSKTAKEVQKRMEKSPNKDQLANSLDQLYIIETGMQALVKLLAQVGLENPDIEQVVEAHEEAEDFIKCELFTEVRGLGPAFQLKFLVAKASCRCLYSKYDEFWQHFLMASELTKSLVDKGFISAILAEVENRVLMTLCAIQPANLSGLSDGVPQDGPVYEALQLCQAMLGVYSENRSSDDFVPASMADDMSVAEAMLGQADVDMKKLGASVKTLQHAAAALEQDKNADADADASVTAIQRFFIQHPVGLAIFEAASGRVQHGKKEAEVQESLEAFEDALRSLETSMPNDEGVFDRVVPPRDAWKVCSSKMKAFKSKKAKNFEVLTKKMERMETKFFGLVETISRRKLQVNLLETLWPGCSPRSSTRLVIRFY